MYIHDARAMLVAMYEKVSVASITRASHLCEVVSYSAPVSCRTVTLLQRNGGYSTHIHPGKPRLPAVTRLLL